jgi:alpha-galactosidase
MVKDNIRLSGWQSWSKCGSSPLIKLLANRFSPFGNDTDTAVADNQIFHKPPVTGWCSWYAFGWNISEEKILTQAKWIVGHREEAPLEHVLIDDGWACWGDWLSPARAKFPCGMKSVAQEIKNLGLRPGLWLAPFLVHPKSVLAKQHPEYLAKDKKEKFVDGLAFHRLFSPIKRWILDIQKQEARAYVEKVLKVVIEEWGFELLKLDFLYAQHFNPEYDSSQMPDSLLGEFLDSIKNMYPQIYTIACGCPLKPAIGKVEAMRISADIIIPQLRNIPFINHWLHSQRLCQLKINLEQRFSTRVFWNLDPDVFVCDKSTGLTKKQVYELLRLIKKAQGLKFLGDDLTKLSKEQIDSFIIPLFKD